MSCNVRLTLLAITDEASLYTTFKSDSRRHFINLNLDLFDFDKHVTDPCFCVININYLPTWAVMFRQFLISKQTSSFARFTFINISINAFNVHNCPFLLKVVFFFTYSLRFSYLYLNPQIDVNARLFEILSHEPYYSQSLKKV